MKTKFLFSLEGLESRIAPASLLHYTDVDGDLVTISSSKGDLAGHAVFAAAGDGQQLQSLDLTNDSFAHANIKITVKKVSGGDGLANVGFIDATGNDLGSVMIKGDLGKIDAGDGNAGTAAIASLHVHSMGQFGTITQGGTVGAVVPAPVTGLVSDLLGNGQGTLNDIQNRVSEVLGGDTSALPDSVVRLLSNLNSNLGSLTSSTDLSNLPANATTLFGNVSHDATGLLNTPNIGSLLGTPLTGLLSQANTTVGQVLTDVPSGVTPIVNLNNIIGQNIGALSGMTLPGATPNVGTLVHNVSDTVQNLLGQTDISQAPVPVQTLLNEVNAELAPVLAGTSPFTSEVAATLSNLQPEVASLLGFASNPGSGISSGTTSLLNGLNSDLQQVLGGNTTAADPNFDLSSNIQGNLTSLRVDMDARDVFLNVDGNVRVANFGGSLIGNQFANGGDLLVSGNLGSLHIGKDLIGGDEANTGQIISHGAVGPIMINGSVIGGAGDHSGALSFSGDVRSLTVRGDVAGGGGEFSGSFTDTNGGVKNVMIHGSITTGNAGDTGTLRVTNEMANLHVYGTVTGDGDHRVDIAATALETKHLTKDPAFGNITVGGSVSFANFLGGYDASLDPVNGDAQIGNVSVHGTWLAGNLVAGVESIGAPDTYGNAGDSTIVADDTAAIISKIASIQIRGSVFGTADAGDHYGFVAQEIDRMTIDGVRTPLTKGPHNDVVQLAEGSGDVTLREVS